MSNYNMEEIEELDDKIESEKKNISHILEIKKLLINNENVTETELIVSLQMLTLIVLSLEDLMATDIGNVVSNLQLHGSRKVIREATRVVDKFKKIIEERVDELAILSERTKGHDLLTTLDEHVLLSPPMDEGFLIGNIPKLEFTTFFEDIDDDGNPIIQNYESEELHESRMNPSSKNNKEMKLQLSDKESTSINTIQKQKQELIDKLISPKNYKPSHKNRKIVIIFNGQRYPLIIENKRTQELQVGEDSQSTKTKKPQNKARKESSETLNKRMYSRPSDTECSLQRFRQQKERIIAENERNTKKEEDKDKVHQVSNVDPRHSQGSSNDGATMDEKLETSKRKLHQGYQAHETVRRSTRFLLEQHDTLKDGYRRRSLNWKYSSDTWIL